MKKVDKLKQDKIYKIKNGKSELIGLLQYFPYSLLNMQLNL